MSTVTDGAKACLADEAGSIPANAQPVPSGFSDGEGGLVYDEAAFRFLLDRERHRAGRLGRGMVLLVVHFHAPTGKSASLGVFRALRRCSREVDVVGWLVTDTAAAALLTDCADGSPNTLNAVRLRAARELRQIGRHVRRRVHIHVRHVGGWI